MKRLFISLAAIIVMLITLVSCGGKKTEDSPATTTNQPTLVDSARSIKVVELDGTATVTDESETINCFKGMNLYDGDIVIVKRCKIARNGEMVVALTHDNEVTLKTFYKEKGYIRLQPENDTMDPIILDNCTIIGKAIGLYRNL